ncbi:MAG: hypothetical protein ABH834_03670 [Candidatus Altiarchaeota archaeon]
MSKFVVRRKSHPPESSQDLKYSISSGADLDRGVVEGMLSAARDATGGLFTTESMESLLGVFDAVGYDSLLAARSGDGALLGLAFAVSMDSADKQRIGLEDLVGSRVVEYSFFVDSSLHRSAVGSNLYNELSAASAGYDAVICVTHRNNAKARRFFEGKGFTLTPSKLVENVVYVKNLGK